MESQRISEPADGQRGEQLYARLAPSANDGNNDTGKRGDANERAGVDVDAREDNLESRQRRDRKLLVNGVGHWLVPTDRFGRADPSFRDVAVFLGRQRLCGRGEEHENAGDRRQTRQPP